MAQESFGFSFTRINGGRVGVTCSLCRRESVSAEEAMEARETLASLDETEQDAEVRAAVREHVERHLTVY